MNEEKLKLAFSKIKEEMDEIKLEISKLAVLETQPTTETLNIDLSKVDELERKIEEYDVLVLENLNRLKQEFELKVQDEVSSLRLELTDMIMNNQQTPNVGDEFRKEMQNFNGF